MNLCRSNGMSAVVFYIFYAFVWVLAWLPLPVLYVITYPVYLLLYYVVRYRKKVVRRNLTNSFPDKSLKEIKQIERRFYLHFVDVFTETLKLIHISDEEMQRRMHFVNPEMMANFAKEKKSMIVMLGHYGNWEWITSIFIDYKNIDGFVAGELYRPLKNKYFDSFFLSLRKRFGTLNIPKNDALRAILGLRREGKTFALGFIADQTPSRNNLNYWNTFLNQETPFLTGPERIARKGGDAVIYFDVRKVKRGYYSCELVLVSPNAKETAENEITDKYVELFENTIKRDPACWLWSHKRWKHKRVDVMDGDK